MLLRQYRIARGEAEAIVLAEEAHAFLLIDEKRARKVAEVRDRAFGGLLRILRLAKEGRIITQVKPLLDKLIENGFCLNIALYEEFLQKLGGL